MKDEIKEIMKNMKEWSVDGNLYFEINDEKAKLLYNYITNLRTIEQQYSAILSENAELENKITHLQERCEYLERSNNRREDEIMSLRDENVDLASENERLKDEIYSTNQVVNELLDIKSRKDKAKEMIRFIAYNSERPLTITELNKVYNILGGDDNEL